MASTIQTHAFPRAALIGNPSDGYHGKTIAFVFSNFKASVTLQPADKIEIVPTERDIRAFDSLEDLDTEIKSFGYYGGLRIIKAAIRKFYQFVTARQVHVAAKNFRIGYASDIPNRLGLAGSSAIITATMRALMQYYEVEISNPMLANLVLSVETEELGIGAGLQDRVAQAYEQPVYMDFDKDYMNEHGFGRYETFSADLLPSLYIAYRTNLAEGSEVVHNNLRERYLQNDPLVHHAVADWAALTDEFYQAMKEGRKDELPPLIDRNFDLRASVCRINRDNLNLIQTARGVGASAKFTGSGGAIIGTYTNEAMLSELRKKMQEIEAEVILPQIVTR